MNSKLFLIPNQIYDSSDGFLPIFAPGIEHVRVFFVEEIRSARRVLKKLNPQIKQIAEETSAQSA